MTAPCFDYFLALFDVLGFRNKFDALGLSGIADRYDLLICGVDRHNEHNAEVFGDGDFKESAYWTAEGGVVIFTKVFGAYASDSILIWAHSAWPEARDKTNEQRSELAKDPARGWMFQTIPCDPFLTVCNELICHSIEVGLPLRGALSMGPAILDESRRVFLGAPLIEAATLERGQRMIGASLCPSLTGQTIPARFRLPFDGHMKAGYGDAYSGMALDWPRHWRKTRTGGARLQVRELSQNAGDAAVYYENTLQFIDFSNQHRDMHEAPTDVSVRRAYAAFSSPHLAASVRPVRRYRPE